MYGQHWSTKTEGELSTLADCYWHIFRIVPLAGVQGDGG